MQSSRLSTPVVGGYPATVTRPAAVTQHVRQVTQPAQGGVYATTRYVGQPQSPVSSTIVRPATAAHTPGVRTVVSHGSAVPTTYTQTSASQSPVTTAVIRGGSQTASMPLTQSVVRMQQPQPGPPQLVQQQAQAATVVQAPHPGSGAPRATRPHTLAGPGYTQNAYEAKHQEDAQLQNLKELRKTSGLKHVPVSDGLSTLKAGASDGMLSREQFLAAYERLLQQQSVDVPSESVRNAVFDLFDRDDNNVVDMMELICGISLLCSGSEEDKIHAVFNVFDENGDGFISMDEMFKFLTSVFKVVLTPHVMGVMNSMGVTVESPEDLASVTALECFKTADLNHDGKLSVVEFKNWFYAPRNDPSFLFSPVRKLLQ